DHARATLDALPGYKALRARVAELDEAAAAVVSTVRLDGKGNIYFTRRAATENTLKLYRRDASGAEALLVDPDDWRQQSGRPAAPISYSCTPLPARASRSRRWRTACSARWRSTRHRS